MYFFLLSTRCTLIWSVYKYTNKQKSNIIIFVYSSSSAFVSDIIVLLHMRRSRAVFVQKALIAANKQALAQFRRRRAAPSVLLQLNRPAAHTQFTCPLPTRNIASPKIYRVHQREEYDTRKLILRNSVLEKKCLISYSQCFAIYTRIKCLKKSEKKKQKSGANYFFLLLWNLKSVIKKYARMCV